ncbi:MAG: (2Fe-2S) ferredoxin domain-containing protein [Magnetospirillum sp.]|nr:(2Fe-2S) ferredoxin domain-containing protein [Magnetospirillum sp.]
MTSSPPPTLLVCTHHRLGAGSCGGSGSDSLRKALLSQVALRGLDWKVEAIGCLGHCAHGPNVKLAGGPLLHGCAADNVLERLLRK